MPVSSFSHVSVVTVHCIADFNTPVVVVVYAPRYASVVVVAELCLYLLLALAPAASRSTDAN